MKIGDLIVTERGIERVAELISPGLYTTVVVVPKDIILECKDKWFNVDKSKEVYFGAVEKVKKSKKSARKKLEKKLRRKIAADVEDKMSYMGTCLNEQNIILGIIRGQRQFTNSLCDICNDLDCDVKKKSLFEEKD